MRGPRSEWRGTTPWIYSPHYTLSPASPTERDPLLFYSALFEISSRPEFTDSNNDRCIVIRKPCRLNSTARKRHSAYTNFPPKPISSPHNCHDNAHTLCLDSVTEALERLQPNGHNQIK